MTSGIIDGVSPAVQYHCLFGCGADVSEPMVCDACFKASEPNLTNARREKSKADARALWAQRTLDAWAIFQFRPVPTPMPDEERQDANRWRVIVIRLGVPKSFFAADPEAARIPAAELVYPDLPEAVRRELGECPT